MSRSSDSHMAYIFLTGIAMAFVANVYMLG